MSAMNRYICSWIWFLAHPEGLEMGLFRSPSQKDLIRALETIANEYAAVGRGDPSEFAEGLVATMSERIETLKTRVLQEEGPSGLKKVRKEAMSYAWVASTREGTHGKFVTGNPQYDSYKDFESFLDEALR